MTNTMNQQQINANVSFWSTLLSVSGFFFLYEACGLITHTLLARFPDITTMSSVAYEYGPSFIDGISYLVCTFIVLLISKIIIDRLIRKDNDISDNKYYVWINTVSKLVGSILFVDLICYPISFYLSGQNALEALVSFIAMIIVTIPVYYVIFENKNSIINKKYFSPLIFVVIAISASILIYKDFSFYGFPSQIRGAQVDIKRMNDVSAIKDALDSDQGSCTADACPIAHDLQEFSLRHPDINIVDPVTNKPYTYYISTLEASSTQYTICADIKTSYTDLLKWYGKDGLPYDFDAKNTQNGNACLTANQDLNNGIK